MARLKTGKKKSPAKGSSVEGATGVRTMTVHVKAKSRHTASSRAWLERQLNDPYVQAAKRDGWRSRAAYKLIEIDDKHTLLRPGQRVIDLGAAPGGWSQVAAKRCEASPESFARGAQVIAIDYLAFDPLPGVAILQLDFTAPTAEDQLKALMRDGGADVVLSDMAAPTMGHTHTDHLRIMGLAELAYAFAADVLVPGGAFLCKVFQGGSEGDLLKALKRDFTIVRHVKPPASRAESAELYVLATGFRGKTTVAPDA
jgi:23S rRNA (uridine2552-2'-O)-methyltransferase